MKPRRRKPQQKPTGGMKGFAAARKTPNDLLREIQSHVVAEGAKNAGVGREAHKIHVSEIVKDTACPRHMYYKLTKTPATDPVKPAFHRMEIIWASGHDAHHKWQRWLKEMGDLWGTWSCLSCEHQWVDTSPESCPECSSSLLRYDEVELEDEHYSIVGHADGAVPRLNSLVEIKSFSIGTVRIENPDLVKKHTYKVDGKTLTDIEGIWASIKRPLKSHLRQGLFYLWLCKQMGLSYDKIIFIYENKTTQATKAFEVTLSMRFIQEFLDGLDEVQGCVAEGVPPKRPALFAMDARPCNECPFRTECWGAEETGDESTADTTVPSGGPVPRSDEAGGAPTVRFARKARRGDTTGPRGHHSPVGPRTDPADDPVDTVGRAPRDATGAGRGGRAVGRGGDGQGTRSRFARQGARRDRAEGQGVRE